MAWTTPDSIRAAEEANERLRRQRDNYKSTTEPLNRVNDTLREILEELKKINDRLRDNP